MKRHVPIYTIDLAPYLSCPQLSIADTVALGKSLLAARPEDLDKREQNVARLAESLGSAVAEGEFVLNNHFDAREVARAHSNVDELHHRLHRLIVRYACGIVSLLDEDDPVSGAAVVDALHPLADLNDLAYAAQ